MKKIFKYKLPRDGKVITIYADIVKWLDIQEQNIWAIVEENGHPKTYEIAAWGAGWMVPDELMSMNYLGTAQDAGGHVWHYFMREADPGYTIDDYTYIQNLNILRQWRCDAAVASSNTATLRACT